MLCGDPSFPAKINEEKTKSITRSYLLVRGCPRVPSLRMKHGSWIHLAWSWLVVLGVFLTNGGSPGTTKSGFLSTVPEEICFAESRSRRNQWWQQEKSGHFSAHISQISVMTTSHDVWSMKNQRLGDSMISGSWENTKVQKETTLQLKLRQEKHRTNTIWTVWKTTLVALMPEILAIFNANLVDFSSSKFQGLQEEVIAFSLSLHI